MGYAQDRDREKSQREQIQIVHVQFEANVEYRRKQPSDDYQPSLLTPADSANSGPRKRGNDECSALNQKVQTEGKLGTELTHQAHVDRCRGRIKESRAVTC